ncbi:arsenical pump membrane protein, partial [Pseudomonas syringae pv. pisi str. 1704B]
MVVYGLRNAGLTDYLANLLDWFAGYGIWGAAMGTGLMTAFLSSIMNNMPTVLIGLLSIDASHASGAIQEAMIYANVIGSDLRRLGTCVRLSRQCRHTLQVNVIIGLGWTLAIVALAAF